MLKKLIRANANINMKNSQGETPLEVALSFGYMDTFKILIQANAGITTKILNPKEKNIKEIHKIIQEERGFYISNE